MIASYFVTRSLQTAGDAVSIEVNGENRYVESLQKDCDLNVTGPLGVTSIRIDRGYAYVLSSPCPHKTCIKMGKISRSGDILVCVPNRILIRILGKSRDIDALTM